MKVICAGLPKTGTKSLTKALRALGYSVYDFPEAILYQKTEWIEIFEGKCTSDIFKRMYDDVDAVVDFPACVMWNQIFEAFPDSKVILQTRDEDQWYDSFLAHSSSIPREVAQGWFPNFSAFLAWWRIFSPVWSLSVWKVMKYSMDAAFGFNAHCHLQNQTLARSGYRKHNVYVQHVCPKEQLLIYDVRDGWEPLCKFLGKSTPNEPFPHLNKNGEFSKDRPGFESFKKLAQSQNAELNGRIRKGFTYLIIFAAFALFVLLL